MLKAIKHAGHRATVQGQETTQFGGRIDAVLGDDDQHLELRGGNAEVLQVAVENAVFDHRGTAQEHADDAGLEVFGGEVRHEGDTCLGS
ncbi:hypothetical protein D3C84_1034010 [compost metagenome]